MTVKLVQATTPGTIPTAMATMCSRGVTSNAWAVMTRPIQTMTAIPASAGRAQATRANEPVRHMSETKIAFRVEYPARAPAAFHAGWPM